MIEVPTRAAPTKIAAQRGHDFRDSHRGPLPEVPPRLPFLSQLCALTLATQVGPEEARLKKVETRVNGLHWEQGSIRKTEKGRDCAVEHLPVDPKRCAMVGWSHVGLIALMAVFDHPEKFAASKIFEHRIYQDAPGGHSFNRIDTTVAQESRKEINQFLEKHLK